MKYIINGDTGFKATEQKAEYQSKRGRAKVHCPVAFNYTDTALDAMPTKGAKDFLTKLGITLQADYKSVFDKFSNDVMKKLNDLEAKLDKAEADFVKKAQKKAPSASEIETFANALDKALRAGCQNIADNATEDYKKLVEDIVDKARTKTLKAMGAAGKPSLKQKAKIAFTVIKFVIVVVAIVGASIALGPAAPIGIAVGVAGIVLKGLSATITLCKDCKAFAKSYESAVTKAAKDLKTAETAVDEALAQVRTAKDSYTALEMKLGKAMEIMKAAEKKAQSGKDPKLDKAKKNIDDAMSELSSYTKTLGNPDIAMKELEAARAAMRKAGTLVPDATKSKSKALGEVASKVQTAIDFTSEAISVV
ncbi:MAG: hypothetical protein ABJR46_10295 [Tateyamaria sp.]|uniref:hypothetical protein n=1 Tax=Tateyamaria sp. TaxID=1929288 RepID=UPI00329EA72F